MENIEKIGSLFNYVKFSDCGKVQLFETFWKIATHLKWLKYSKNPFKVIKFHQA